MMVSKYKAYSEYRSSEIEWITDIPKHWGTSYLGFECSVKARLGWRGLKAEEYVDKGFVFLATPNIKEKEIDFVNVDRITKERYDESPEIMLREGDVLVTKDGSTTGTTNAVRLLPEPATVNSSIAVLRTKGKLISAFLFYFFTSDYTQNIINRMRGGMGVPHLFQADLRKFDLLIPPIEEQQNIANFLDHETARIDILIEKQQQLITLLEEKRQAVVSHAVFKGLNPDAPMRDSGVEWLGKVPKHWVVAKIKNLAIIISKGTTPSTIGGDFVDKGVRFLKGENIGKSSEVMTLPEFFISEEVDEKISRSRLEENDVLVIIAGATTGLASILQKELLPANTNQAVSFIRPRSSYNSKYIIRWLSTEFAQRIIWMGAVQAAQPNLSMEDLGNIPVAVPPSKELIEITEDLDRRLMQFDELHAELINAINLMKERRRALISAAVTGKIDVRNWQAPEPPINNTEEAMA